MTTQAAPKPMTTVPSVAQVPKQSSGMKAGKTLQKHKRGQMRRVPRQHFVHPLIMYKLHELNWRNERLAQAEAAYAAFARTEARTEASDDDSVHTNDQHTEHMMAVSRMRAECARLQYQLEGMQTILQYQYQQQQQVVAMVPHPAFCMQQQPSLAQATQPMPRFHVAPSVASACVGGDGGSYTAAMSEVDSEQAAQQQHDDAPCRPAQEFHAEEEEADTTQDAHEAKAEVSTASIVPSMPTIRQVVAATQPEDLFWALFEDRTRLTHMRPKEIRTLCERHGWSTQQREKLLVERTRAKNQLAQRKHRAQQSAESTTEEANQVGVASAMLRLRVVESSAEI
eukprot:m.7965 g.7965  ORF g.7965 m.7965 type:complete len:340 (+) comp5304_c0_seq1:154-1173(+)